MSNKIRTIQVHPNNPVSAEPLHDHIHKNVAWVEMDDDLILFADDNSIIAAYQERAWASWNVVPGTETPVKTRIEQHRDSKGRLTKREETAEHAEPEKDEEYETVGYLSS